MFEVNASLQSHSYTTTWGAATSHVTHFSPPLEDQLIQVEKQVIRGYSRSKCIQKVQKQVKAFKILILLTLENTLLLPQRPEVIQLKRTAQEEGNEYSDGVVATC